MSGIVPQCGFGCSWQCCVSRQYHQYQAFICFMTRWMCIAELQAARERFNEFLQMASLPADDADVERVRRERREAAAKDGVKLSEADLPDKFYKLPRIRFLLLLCKELLRINR